MKNPDKYLRAAYLVALRAQGLEVFNKSIPVSTTPPELYVLVETQSKDTTEINKTDFDYRSRVTLNIVKVNTRGYSETSLVDDAEEKCINAIEAGVQVQFFRVKSTEQIHSGNLDMDFKTGTIERRVLIYEHWLSEVEGLTT